MDFLHQEIKMIKRVDIENEGIYLKKDRFGWRVIHPIKNSDGSWNWKNLLIGGSYWNLFKIGLIVGLLLFLIFSYLNDISSCKHLIECGAKCPKTFLGSDFI